ncbi:unnamed protein product [Protopolystoma xenopodis]|uniref:Uncharacterized protein n=1 Tax=Protopolystoma xenopodis TaxID=117903 RepID=A0A3S5ALV7_9PLAT|nr:unnamed protein product [Protopolystoma xenopodis]
MRHGQSGCQPDEEPDEQLVDGAMSHPFHCIHCWGTERGFLLNTASSEHLVWYWSADMAAFQAPDPAHGQPENREMKLAGPIGPIRRDHFD